MKLLCIAAKADPTGYVTVNGRPLGVTDIARTAGVTETECESLLAELERNGVFSRDRKKTIYSRRMVRDAKKSQTAKNNGGLGGNPSLRKQMEKTAPVNRRDNPSLNTQEPESNSHKPSSESPPVFRSDDPVFTALMTATAGKIGASPRLLDTSSIRRLIDDGYSLESTILPKVRALAAATHKGWSSWEYVAKIIRTDAVPHSKQSNGSAVDDALWAKTLANGRKLKAWDVKNYGPMPHQPGCRVPTHMLKPDDGQGWTEWKAAS